MSFRMNGTQEGKNDGWTQAQWLHTDLTRQKIKKRSPQGKSLSSSLSLSLSRCVDRKDAHTKSPSSSSSFSSLSHNSVVHWCMRWFIVWVRCVKCVLVSALVLNGKLVARVYHSRRRREDEQKIILMNERRGNEWMRTDKANNEVAHAERACAPT